MTVAKLPSIPMEERVIRPDAKRQAPPERIIRQPAQPRSNLARFRRGSELASRLEEAATLSPRGRHRVWDALHVEVTEMFKELLGESVVKIEREHAA